MSLPSNVDLTPRPARARRGSGPWGVALALLVMVAAPGCSDEGGVVRLDLCPGRSATQDDLAALRQATSWELTVWGMRGDDVSWREPYTTEGAAATLGLEATVPPDQQVRLMVEGWSTATGDRQLVAVASSGLLQLSSGIWICLCTARPDHYEQLCPYWECAVDRASGACWP